ncbi:MAG: hypothetical protein GWO24_13605 [Akkermansiaceae bacterium]|nr:hypothetical protein [Akkermansiaceae bacterium]
MDHKQAVIYKGPFREVVDDDGHRLRRGRREAVCEKTFRILGGPAYSGHFQPVEPREPVASQDAKEFDRPGAEPRDPRETKGTGYHVTSDPDPCCENGGCC